MIKIIVNNLDVFITVIKTLACVLTLGIIPFIIHIIKVFSGWNEYVSNWSSINKYTVNACGNKWFAFHSYTFSSGAPRECQERYRYELKENKIRYIRFFEKYIIFREDIWHKKRAKERAKENKKIARENKTKIRQQINEAIPGFLD